MPFMSENRNEYHKEYKELVRVTGYVDIAMKRAIKNESVRSGESESAIINKMARSYFSAKKNY